MLLNPSDPQNEKEKQARTRVAEKWLKMLIYLFVYENIPSFVRFFLFICKILKNSGLWDI
jgi:hypothetical protein